MTRWQFTGFDSDDDAAEYIDAVTGEAYYHRRRDYMPPEPVPLQPEPKLLETMAREYGLAPKAFENTLRATVFPKGSNEQLAAFLLVARKYRLNPFTREIYAIARGDGIQTIVPIDGWLHIINDHEAFDGMELEEHFSADGALVATTCKIYRKDRSHPMVKTEYFSECAQDTTPWKKWPVRMLGHKATIQAARYAFSLSGIIDPDEAERFIPEARAAAAPPIQEVKRPYSINKEEYEKRLTADLNRDPIEVPKKEPSSTDVATAEAAYELGREAQAKGAGKSGWPGFWKDKQNIAEWQRGWSEAEDQMTSERAIDAEPPEGQ